MGENLSKPQSGGEGAASAAPVRAGGGIWKNRRKNRSNPVGGVLRTPPNRAKGFAARSRLAAGSSVGGGSPRPRLKVGARPKIPGRLLLGESLGKGKEFHILIYDKRTVHSGNSLEGHALPLDSLFRRYARFLLVGLLVMMVAHCAGLQPPSPLPAVEQAAQQPRAAAISHLRQELVRDEARLPGAGNERANLLIRLARTSYLLGDLLPRENRQVYLDKASHFAELLLKEQPRRVEGYYWSSMSLCGNAEICGAGRALRMLPEIVARLKQAVAIDPGYDQAGPHRVLGRIYSEAPGWPLSVGDLHKSLEHLRLAVRIAPHNSTNQLFLGETLLRLERRAEAKEALEAVFSCTDHAVWPPGIFEDRRKAGELLKKLASSATIP